MKVESVITLENDVNCLLLDEAVYENEKYFLATVLDEKDEPTDETIILKEINDNGDMYVEREGDPQKTVEILQLFTKNLNKIVGSLSDKNI